MTPRRNNVVAILGERAPALIGWLEIPLTPARAARLADFCARTGIDAQSLVLDLLDDVIFNIADSVVSSRGQVPCTGTYRSGLRAREKSTDTSVGSRQNCRDVNSDPSPSSCGHTKQRPSSQAFQDEISEPPNGGFPASSSRPPSSSQPSSSRSPSGTDLCGNE